MKKIIKYITAHKIISGIVIVVLIGIGYFTYTKLHSSTTPTQYVFGKVTRGDLVVSVSGTGQVATLSKVDIKPQTTGQTQTLGQIIKVNVQNGQTVKAGDVIAILDGKTALQAVNQAKSGVASAQANYDKLVNGPTASDLQSYQNSIQSAETSLQNAIQNIATKLQTDYIAVSNSVYLNTDPFFTNPSVQPTFNITDVYFNDQSLENKVQSERTQIGGVLDSLKNAANNATSSQDQVALANDAILKFTTVRSYFDDMTTLFTTDAESISTTGASNINSDKTAASSARSTANTAISDMISALQTYQNAVTSLAQAKTSLSFKQAPANPDDVVVAQAQLDNAKATLSNAEQTYASRIITAPFDGQIGGLTAQVGQQISSSDILGEIITPQKVVNVSLNEVDAAKVSAGDPVTLTFDALPNVTLNGNVSYVDPLGTVSQGVVNYAVQIGLTDQNDQVKAGMTASANITTNTESGVLIVPSSAITKTGNRSFVLVPNSPVAAAATGMSSSTYANNYAGFASSTRSFNGNGTSTGTGIGSTTRPRGTGTRTFGAGGATATGQQAVTATVHQVPVSVGISNDTMTEILSGLNEGDTIVTRTITGTAGTTAATGTARPGSIFGVGGGGGGAVRTGGGGGGRIGG